MRYAWIAFTLLFLDQASKWLITTPGFVESHQIAVGNLIFKLEIAKPLTVATIGASLANSTTLILLAGLIGIHLLISRFSVQSHFISMRTLLALQLGGGGIISQALDIAVRGHVYSPLGLEINHSFTINAGFADLALLGAFALLLYVLFISKPRLISRVTLAPADLAPLNFTPIPRGIDNIHIDIQLSPKFKESINQLIQYLLPLVVGQLQQGRPRPAVAKKYSEKAHNAFKELLTLSLRKVRDSGEKQFPDLFITALLKFVHDSVNEAVANLVKQVKEEGNLHFIRGLKPQAKQPQLVEWLFRYRSHITALTNQILLETLCDQRGKALEKHIRTLFDKKSLFAVQAMQSPMVLAGFSNDQHMLMEHYLLLGQQQNDPNSFVNIDKVLAQTFSDCLALVEETDEHHSHLASSTVSSNTLDTLMQPSVLMHSGNIAILLSQTWSTKKLNKSLKTGEWRRYTQFRLHQKFQKRLWQKLKADLNEAGLAPWIAAAYQCRSILKAHRSDMSPGLLLNLLARSTTKQEFQQRLRDALRSAQTPLPAEAVIQAWREIHQATDLLDRYLLPFVQDFARYRRDLLLLLTYQQGANEIRLLHEAHEIETSRANYTLYEFLQASEMRTSDAPILSHVIIKADLRGSTEVTEKLTELELNPATHFERNFFVPINEVIENYGAEKVFIEGDAIILILNEYGGPHQDHMVASRACGLAAQILQIVAKQNRELEVYGLPQLELGIGVAFQQGAARYLFDKQHRITISPAINRADRLSSSTWSVRNWRKQQNFESAFVEVYQPSDTALNHGEKAQKDLTYNINGINLEESVFKRLTSEQKLRKISHALKPITDSELYIGAFFDLIGTAKSLVIRKAPMHLYDPKYRVSECPVVEQRYFYEVIHRPELLEQLRKKR
jgi:class 3 adenylate cyclase/lipoprotein signal peptidase